MKSLPWGNAGNFNMRGKKTARYTDDIIQNFKEREYIKQITKDAWFDADVNYQETS